MAGRVDIRVAGQKFSVTHDQDESYVKEIAQYVNDKITELRQRTGAVATHSLALLAALDIADQYFQECKKTKDLRKDVRDRVIKALGRVQEQIGEQNGVSVRAAADLHIDQRMENDG
jgi:cell division protein ZapA